MTSYEYVLVPTDGSPLAGRAAPVALAMAERLGARTAVVSVASTDGELEPHEAHVDALAERLGADRDARWVVVESAPAKGIVFVAGELDLALVCMSSHGHGRSAALVGSVAQDVLEALGAPVLLVGPTAVPGPVDAPVVIAVDGSEASEAALDVGIDWAAALGVDARIVTVAEPVPEPIGDRPAHRAHGPDGDVDAYLEALVERVARTGGPPVSATAIADPVGPASGLRSWLEPHPAQVVVATTHARAGLRRVVAGSSAARIVHDIPAPVLLVPPRP